MNEQFRPLKDYKLICNRFASRLVGRHKDLLFSERASLKFFISESSEFSHFSYVTWTRSIDRYPVPCSNRAPPVSARNRSWISPEFLDVRPWRSFNSSEGTTRFVHVGITSSPVYLRVPHSETRKC